MELRHIRYFLAVAEAGNFSRAAEKVGIAQPPLSHQIKNLEIEVGTRLFRRIPHGAELTEAGAAFFQELKELPQQLEEAKRSAQRAARGETGSLRVGFTGSTTFHPVVAASIRTFRRAYPDVALSLIETNTAGLSHQLDNGALDAAFLRPGPTGCEEFTLYAYPDEPMVAALPASHEATNGTYVTLQNLQSDPFLFTPRESGLNIVENVIAACRICGFEPIIGQSAPQIGSVVNLVASELGVAVIPASMQALQVPGVTYRPIKGQEPTINLSLALRRDTTSQTLRNFLSCARQTAKQLNISLGPKS